MARKYTVEQFRQQLEKIATVKQLNKAILPPFRKGLKIMQRALFKEYWSNKFGARIWKWTENKFSWTTSSRSGASVFTGRTSGPSVKLGSKKRRSYARWSQSESAYVGRIFVLGLAAKMEEGGRLRRHVPYGREALAYKPGLPVPRHQVFKRVVEEKLWTITVDKIGESFGKFVERTL